MTATAEVAPSVSGRESREVHPVVRAQHIAARVERLERQHREALHERLVAVAQLVQDGYSHTEIGRLLGLSKPRAGQLVTQARDEGLLPPAAG